MSHLFYIALLDVLQAFLRKKRLDKNLPSLELFLRGKAWAMQNFHFTPQHLECGSFELFQGTCWELA